MMHDIHIKTERLLLRPLHVADAEEVFQWVSDERVTKYMNYTTYTDVEQVREWLASVEKDVSEDYNFGFERSMDGKLIGSGDIRYDAQKGSWGFGYNIRYDCWGMGYATEATKAKSADCILSGMEFFKNWMEVGECVQWNMRWRIVNGIKVVTIYGRCKKQIIFHYPSLV